RDHIFGRTSAYKAFLQPSTLIHSLERVTPLRQLITKAFKLARDVPWIRQECGMMLYDFIQNLEPSEEGTAIYADAILEELVAGGLAKTPEGVAIWLAVRSKDLKVSFPAHIWHKNDPLCPKERKALAVALKEKNQGFDNDADPTHLVKSGSWQANVSFA